MILVLSAHDTTQLVTDSVKAQFKPGGASFSLWQKQKVKDRRSHWKNISWTFFLKIKQSWNKFLTDFCLQSSTSVTFVTKGPLSVDWLSFNVRSWINCCNILAVAMMWQFFIPIKWAMGNGLCGHDVTMFYINKMGIVHWAMDCDHDGTMFHFNKIQLSTLRLRFQGFSEKMSQFWSLPLHLSP